MQSTAECLNVYLRIFVKKNVVFNVVFIMFKDTLLLVVVMEVFG